MRVVFARDESKIYDAVTGERNRVTNHQLKATPDVADRLGKAYTMYNWVNPAIVASTVLSGNDHLLPEIGKAVAKKASFAGFSPTDVRPDKMTPQEMLMIQSRVRSIPSANKRYTPPKKQEGGPGWWGHLPGYSLLATIGDFVTPEAAENIIGSVRGAAYEEAKQLSRTFQIGAMYIPQAAQNLMFAAANYLPSGHSFQTQRNKSLFDQFIRGPLFEETYAGQYISQSGKGKMATSAGKGFGIGGTVLSEQEKAAAEYRPLLGENRVPMTFGRSGGQALADVGVIEEGSTLYNVVSGLIDAGIMVRLDPAFGRKKEPFGAGGKAATAITDTDAIKATAGVVNGQRPSVNPTMWNGWKTTPEAVNVLDPLVKEKDAAVIWRNMKRQGLMTAKEVADADTHEGVVTAIENAVNNLDPAYHMREVPTGNVSTLSDAGYNIKQSVARNTRLFAVMPESLFIPKNDINVAAQRVDDLMHYLGFDMETRNAWINKLLEKYNSGSKGFFEYLSDWETSVLGNALKENGVPNDVVSRLTRWRQYTVDSTARTTLQDVANGAIPSWMGNNNMGPLRLTQLMQDGAYLVDPSVIDEVTFSLGKLYKLEQQATKLAEKGKLPVRVGAELGRGVLKGVELGSSALSWYQSKLWKVSAIVRGTYLTKVLPDEQLRVLLNGTFEHPMDYVAAMMDGRFAAKLGIGGTYTEDVFGTAINKAVLLGETENEIIDLVSVQDEIARLLAKGETAAAEALQNQYANELSRLPDLYVLRERTEKILNENQPGLHQAMIQRTPDAARKRLLGEYQSGGMMRSKISDIASRLDKTQHKFWVQGVLEETADLNNNPHIRRIANGGLFDNDVLTLDGIKTTWKNHVAAGRGNLSAQDAIARWLFEGSGREYFAGYFTNYANIADGFQWDNIGTSQELVRMLEQEVSSIAGSDGKLLRAIATGSFDGKKAFTRNPNGTWEIVDEMKQHVANSFINDPSAPTHVRFRPNRLGDAAQFVRGATAIENAYTSALDFFFGRLYGVPSDKLSRSPAFRAGYWGRIEEVAPILSPEAAQELKNNLATIKLPQTQKDRLNRLLSLANGTNDLEAADLSARGYGLQYARNLLFDATKRSWFADHHKFLFPFFEAWREQGTTWMKLLVEQPQNGHKIDVAIRGLRGLKVEDYNNDGKKDYFLSRDPQTGEELLTVPLTGALGQIFSGVQTEGLKLPLSSMAMIFNVLPGVGPVAQYPTQYMIPSTKNWDWLNRIVFPFGRPEETGQAPLGGAASLAVPMPLWYKRATPYLSQQAKQIPFVGGTLGQMVSDLIKATGGNEEETQTYQSYHANVLKSLASESPIPKTAREYEQFMDEVNDKTNKLYALRALGNFIAPGTPVTKFLANTKAGPIEIGILADKLRTYEKEAEEAGLDRNIGTMNFLNVYGSAAWGVFTSVRKSVKYEGLVMSREFEDWFDSNQDLIKTYPKIASYFGPRDQPEKFGAAEQGVYNRFITKGALRAQTGEEQIVQAQNRLANTIYSAIRSQMSTVQQNSQVGKQQLRSMREALKSEFPKWDTSLAAGENKSIRDEQLRELAEIVKEPAISKSDVGKSVSAYLAFRNDKIAQAKTVGVVNWQKGSRTAGIREQLFALGEGLSENVVGFKDLWRDVLSREFDPPEVDNG